MDQYLAFLAGFGQDTSDFDDDHLLDIIQKCPICSKKSNNVIPSRFWSGDPKTKEIYQSEYKKNFEMKKCPYEIFESGLWTIVYGGHFQSQLQNSVPFQIALIVTNINVYRNGCHRITKQMIKCMISYH